MRNIAKRIITIFLIITLVVLSLQEFCYADGGSSASGGLIYYGKGNPSYPNLVAFPFYNIIVCDKMNNPIINCYIASSKFQGQIDGASTVMAVEEGENRTMMWKGTRTINIADTIKSAGKELVYSSSFESFASTPLLISGMGWNYVNRQAFQDWAVKDNKITAEMIQCMKDLDAYSKCGIPEGSTTMEVAPSADGAPTNVTVDNFEAWLRGYDFNTNTVDQVNKPYVALCECLFAMGNKQVYWLEKGTTEPKHYNIDNKKETWYLFENNITWSVKVNSEGINSAGISNAQLSNQIQLAMGILGSSIKNTGIVSGWQFGNSGGGGGGGGSTPPTPPTDKPNTGNTANMELYDDELSYYYSMTNVNLGTNRKLTYIINEGGTPHNPSIDMGGSCSGSHMCSQKTNGDFTVVVSHTTNGATCIIVGTQTGDGTYTFTAQELQTGTVALPEGGTVNQWVTGFRDKAMDLRTMWGGSTYAPVDSGVEQQLQQYGIGKGYAPVHSAQGEEGKGSFQTQLQVQYTCSISGQTKQCTNGGSHTYHDGCGDAENPCPGHSCSYSCSGGGVGGTIEPSYSLLKGDYDNVTFTQYFDLGKKTTGEYITSEESEGYKWLNESNRPTFDACGKDFGFVNSSGNMMTQNFEDIGSIDIYPYVKMSFASLDHTDWRTAYICSENISSVKDYLLANAGVSTRNADVKTISVQSNQWAGWKEAMDGLRKFGVTDKSSLVSGGSTMYLYTRDSRDMNGNWHNISRGTDDNTYIGVEAYMTCVPDSEQSTYQVFTNTESQVKEYYDEFIEEASNNINDFYLEKWVAEGIALTDAQFENGSANSNPAVRVDGGYYQASSFGGRTLDWTRPKYYFGMNNTDRYNESKIDLLDQNGRAMPEDELKPIKQKITTFTIRSDTEGNVYCMTNGSVAHQFLGKDCKSGDKANVTTINSKLSGEWKKLNRLTGFVDNFIETLDFNMGESGTTNRSGKPTAKGWYNEASIVSCVKLEAYWKIGLDVMRYEVIDPKLCGDSDNKEETDIYNNDPAKVKQKWRTFRYQLSHASNYSGTEFYLGTIGETQIFCENIEECLKSKLMYMSNYTSEDVSK